MCIFVSRRASLASQANGRRLEKRHLTTLQNSKNQLVLLNFIDAIAVCRVERTASKISPCCSAMELCSHARTKANGENMSQRKRNRIKGNHFSTFIQIFQQVAVVKSTSDRTLEYKVRETESQTFFFCDEEFLFQTTAKNVRFLF